MHEQQLRIEFTHGVYVTCRRRDAYSLDVDRVEHGVARTSLGAHSEQCYGVLVHKWAVALVRKLGESSLGACYCCCEEPSGAFGLQHRWVAML